MATDVMMYTKVGEILVGWIALFLSSSVEVKEKTEYKYELNWLLKNSTSSLLFVSLGWPLTTNE